MAAHTTPEEFAIYECISQSIDQSNGHNVVIWPHILILYCWLVATVTGVFRQFSVDCTVVRCVPYVSDLLQTLWNCQLLIAERYFVSFAVVVKVLLPLQNW